MGASPVSSHLRIVSSTWASSALKPRWTSEPLRTRWRAPTGIPIHPHPPPTLCLCSELEWLVFHFGPPAALLHSLAWLVYHYWSLSLTWTNRGLFSKVVSQVAVTVLSGTAGLGAWHGRTESHEKMCQDISQAPSHTLTTRSHCSGGVWVFCFSFKQV